MATIEKRGGSYKIVVSKGYDIKGKQLRERMTWTPPPGLSQRQIAKELNRQATLFTEATSNWPISRSSGSRTMQKSS